MSSTMMILILLFLHVSTITTNSSALTDQISSFSTPPIHCSSCEHGKEPSPECFCVYPFTGTLFFTVPSFSPLSNTTNFIILRNEMVDFLKKFNHPVDTIAIRNIRANENHHQLQVDICVFPLRTERFTQMEMTLIGFVFSKQDYKPPTVFGQYYFKADMYHHFTDEGASKSPHRHIVIGLTVGVSVLVLLLAGAGAYAYMQKKKAQRAPNQDNPFAMWDTSISHISAPRLMGARAFSFEELQRCTEDFSEANTVGEGGYGKVYRGVLPTGEIIAIKRAQKGSFQGDLEFKTEVEFLSRVHHRNVVKLLGFCFNQQEQMLIYEFIPNGSLRDSLSGKSRIHLDWERRIHVALGASKGLLYLHEHADPPIIHRDVKSHNILLDQSLSAKVADFGLSRLVGDAHVSTQMKGTMGYMDPEYYMRNLVSKMTDVYAFGVVMLELLTSKIPIVKGEHVVMEVKMKMDKSRTLYGLQELLDSTLITSSGNLNGFEKYVELALRCVEKEGDNRPSMGEVVKEIENIMQLAGLNPNVDEASSSRTHEEASSSRTYEEASSSRTPEEANRGSGSPYGNG